jgi:hypothetical protein
MFCGRAQSLELGLHHLLHIPRLLELGVPSQQIFAWPFGSHQNQSIFAVIVDENQ